MTIYYYQPSQKLLFQPAVFSDPCYLLIPLPVIHNDNIPDGWKALCPEASVTYNLLPSSVEWWTLTGKDRASLVHHELFRGNTHYWV